MNESTVLTWIERPPPPMPVALQLVKEQCVIVKSSALSTSILTAPPFVPAMQDVKERSERVREVDEERVKANAPPSSRQTQEMKVRLERVREEVMDGVITAPPPLFFVMESNVVFVIESVDVKEEVPVESEKVKRESDLRVIEVKTLSEQLKTPDPTEKMEVE